ncbi:hypothetical protein P389DRAFT_64574 [Cystobasidium minutum MCA 4210]|uniref:uncharacterized protein n=1 Tax=Cystobasidium minutum MCA 4210 TaxID=1397322 RepID=UPI0034CF36F0|eukprot:jgi/Rhomi1/64574/CE64573_41
MLLKCKTSQLSFCICAPPVPSIGPCTCTALSPRRSRRSLPKPIYCSVPLTVDTNFVEDHEIRLVRLKQCQNDLHSLE